MDNNKTLQLAGKSNAVAQVKRSDTETSILLARKKERVKTLKIENVEIEIYKLINLAYFELKYAQPADDELVKMAQIIASDVKLYFSTLTIDEIAIAFKMGARGNLGEFTGLSVATFNKWLSNFTQCKERTDAIKYEKSLLHKEPEPPTKEQIEKISKEATIKCFNGYKQSGQIVDFGNAIFHYLESNGIINLTLVKKMEIYNICKQRLEYNLTLMSKAEPQKFKRNEIAKRLEELKVNPKFGELIYESRVEALKQFFDNLIEFNGNIIDYLP